VYRPAGSTRRWSSADADERAITSVDLVCAYCCCFFTPPRLASECWRAAIVVDVDSKYARGARRRATGKWIGMRVVLGYRCGIWNVVPRRAGVSQRNCPRYNVNCAPGWVC
jgi:hypothetical protein